MDKTMFKSITVFILTFVTLAEIIAGAPSKDELLSVADNSITKEVAHPITKYEHFLIIRQLLAIKEKNTVEETMEFLEEGYKALNISKNPDIVAVLGNTGAGKTTFTHFIAADNDLLKAVKANDDPYNYEYVIEDEYDKISKRNETTISKTIVPELVIDEEGISWYDCPGFSDTRNTTVEISSTFFINKIIENGKRLKLVFVVNYASVTTGGDRTDFDTLVRYAVNLVHSIKKYKPSVGLVVTKVDGYPPHSDDPIPQWVFALRAGKFILDYRQGLNGDDDETKRAIDLLDILLQKDKTGNYTQISVFYRPDREGPLSEIPIMIQNREETRKMLKTSLEYTKIDQSDFGYTLTQKAQNEIIELAQLINKNVTDSVGNIGKEIITFFEQQVNNDNHLIELRDIFKSAGEGLAVFKPGGDELTLKALLAKIQKFLKDQQIFISKTEVENLFNQQQYLEFLNRVSTKVLPISPNDWLAALQPLIEYVTNENNWYTFLVSLFDDFSEYKIQNSLELWNVADLSNWGKGGGKSGIVITRNNFRQFLDLQPTYQYLIKDIQADDTKVATLNKMLEVTLRHEISYQCEGDTMTVKREYLKLSEIDLEKCNSDVKRLQFFALNTFFTDKDLVFAGDDNEVSIIAYHHVVTTDVTFSLQGNDSSFLPPKPNEPDEKHLAGATGVPGKAGLNGANFVTLSNDISNGDRLKVNIYGGAGSPGQDGGKAYPQRSPAKLSNDKYKIKITDQLEMLKELEKDIGLAKMKDQGLITEYTSNPLAAVFGVGDFFLHYKCCEADGLAGAGGIGGHTGLSKVITLDEIEKFPKIESHEGKNGTNGTNVEPCIAKVVEALYGIVDYTYTCVDINACIPVGVVMQLARTNLIDEDEKHCPRKPVTGFNEEGREYPPQKQPFRPYESIISYKTYIRENLNAEGLRNIDLDEFYEKIENNTDVQAVYSPHAFGRELQSLENHFYKLNNEIDFLPFYDSLVDRINNFSQTNNETTTVEDRKILAWLYTSAVSKAQGLKTNRYTSLVIDILTYFDSSIGTINRFNDASKIEIMNNTKNQYEGELNAKINEATNLISTEIQPEINNILGGFDTALDSLVDETIALENATEEHIHELEEARKKLQENMGLHLLTGIFKGIGQFMGFLGPLGEAAGAAIGTASSIGDQFIVDPNTPGSHFTLPPGVRDALDKAGKAVKETAKAKMDALDEEIKKFEDFINQPEGSVIRDITKTAIDDVKAALDEERKKDDPDKEKIDELNKKMVDLLKDEKENLKGDNEEFVKKADKYLTGAKNALDVINTSVNIYNQYKADQAKIDEISKNIEQAKEQLLQLQAFEAQIYQMMWPMINAMKGDILNLENDLEGRSLVSLDVQKWKTQSMLRDMKNILVSMTAGFEAGTELQHVVDKLNDAITTLIGIYDRIQEYQEQKRMILYMEALASTPFQQIQIQDPEMKGLINSLEIVVDANIILAQYLNAVKNFKQSVFPFAETYLAQYMLPSSLNLNESIDELTKVVTTQISTLNDKIKELNSSINGNDKDIFTGYFSSGSNVMDPFYVWTVENNKAQINDLLSGKKVMMNADVTESSKYNAVKLNFVGLEFNLRNDPDEASKIELKKTLNNFTIQMIHPGNSYYRCNNQFYLVGSTNQTLEFSYEKKAGTIDVPTSSNGVYDKIRGGNMVLSPYTLWTIQLFTDGDFSILEKYRDQVDIELYGFGQYVRRDANICNSDLERYYDLDASLSEPNNVRHGVLVETPPNKSNYLQLDYLLNKKN